MSDDLRSRGLKRKLIYFGIILGLFTLSMFWRGVIELPFGDPNRGAKVDPDTGEPVPVRPIDEIARWPVRFQADDLELRELDMGDPEIAGSAAQVSLVGFRGLVVTALWNAAIQKQKRGEYHDMELYARMVTRMQPHFIEPWIFQAWNIAYNVSVENDKLGDQYFYIARGIGLLSEGDRINTRTYRRGGSQFRIGSPDIRYQLGFYFQNKFTVSDKVNTLRSLAQLSCIPPADRDPARLTEDGTPDGRVNPERFLAFCQKYPQLVRRLRTQLNLQTREQVAQFLNANRSIPARYDESGRELLDVEAFPVFPPTDPLTNPELDSFVKQTLAKGRPTADGRQPVDNIDAVHAARAWFEYAQEVVPPAKEGEPSAVPQKGEYDEFRYRIPHRPALIVFRMAPARAQTYVAERLLKEGWIDPNSVWEPDATSDVKWFPAAVTGGREPVRLTAGLNAKQEWRTTNDLWVRFGKRNGMNPEHRQRQEDLAYVTVRAGLGPLGTQLPRQYTPEELEKLGVSQEAMRARNAIIYYEQNRQITNYQYFLDSSELETDERVAQTRQLVWDADQLHVAGDLTREIDVRVKAQALWREAIGSPKHQEFYASERADSLHEFTLRQETTLATVLLEGDPIVTRRIAQAKLAAGTVGVTAAAATFPQLPRVISEDEAQVRIAAAYSSPELDRRVAELMAAAAQLPGEKPTAEATRRGLIQGEFSWMKEHADPAKTQPWVKPSLRMEYLSRIGAVSEPKVQPGDLVPTTPELPK